MHTSPLAGAGRLKGLIGAGDIKAGGFICHIRTTANHRVRCACARCLSLHNPTQYLYIYIYIYMYKNCIYIFKMETLETKPDLFQSMCIHIYMCVYICIYCIMLLQLFIEACDVSTDGNIQHACCRFKISGNFDI